MTDFTHISGDAVRMVSIGEKPVVRREATAEGRILLRKETLQAIREGTVIKGNVLATARVAAALAVKDTPRTIPMCHAIPVDGISIGFEILEDRIDAKVTVTSLGRTGVEMEALCGVTVALLTVWDMVKSAEKDRDGQYPVTAIEGIRVIEKIKGEPGNT